MHYSFSKLLFGAAAVMVAAAPSAAQSSAPVSLPAATSAVLIPGDAVRISVWRKPELSGEFMIAVDSTIADPFYMELKVAGRSMSEVSRLVYSHIAHYETTPRVLVEPMFRISVGGEVRQPGLLTLGPETTVAQAVLLAGGPTERGRMDHVRLVRDGRLQVLDLSGEDAGPGQTPIQSGDQIVVVRRRNVFRDIIAPTASIAGAVASIINVFVRYR